MVEIVWTQEAERWMDTIYAHVAADSPEAAGRVIKGIYEKRKFLPNTRKSAGDIWKSPTAKSVCCSKDITESYLGFGRKIVSKFSASITPQWIWIAD